MRIANICMLCTFCLLFISCNTSNKSPQQKAINYDLTVAEAEVMLQEREMILVDVRTPGEISKGKILNALEIDYRNDDFEKEFLKLDKKANYLLYCASGGRSSRAMKKLNELGYVNVYNMLGGYKSWEKNRISN